MKMDVNKAIGICFGKGILIYPVVVGRSFQIEWKEGDNKPVRYPKKVKAGKETSEALAKTYIFLAKKILEDEEKKNVKK